MAGETVHVRATAAERGGGRALPAGSRGHAALGLSVAERNQAARRPYERVGFVVVGREGDALTMRRELPGGAS